MDDDIDAGSGGTESRCTYNCAVLGCFNDRWFSFPQIFFSRVGLYIHIVLKLSIVEYLGHDIFDTSLFRQKLINLA